MIEPAEGRAPGPEPHRRQPAAPRSRPLALVAMFLAALIVGGAAGAGAALAVVRSQARTNPQSVDLGSHVTINVNDAVTQVAAKARPAVVAVITGGSSEDPRFGSGFFATSDGYVVTAIQVIAGAPNLSVLASGFSQPRTARVVDYDCEMGVAVLKVDGVSGLPTLSFGDSSALKPGEIVVALAGGLDPNAQVSRGTVSGLHGSSEVTDPLAQSGTAVLQDTVQTDAVTQRGLPGGPLLNVGGQVVGVVVSPAGGGSAAAVAADDIQASVSQIISSGRLLVPGMGATFTDLTQAQAALRGTPAGALVTAVEAGGPAELAGLRAGDVITQVDEIAVNDADPLGRILRDHYSPSQRVTVTYSRASSSSQVQLVLMGGRPACS